MFPIQSVIPPQLQIDALHKIASYAGVDLLDAHSIEKMIRGSCSDDIPTYRLLVGRVTGPTCQPPPPPRPNPATDPSMQVTSVPGYTRPWEDKITCCFIACRQKISPSAVMSHLSIHHFASELSTELRNLQILSAVAAEKCPGDQCTRSSHDPAQLALHYGVDHSRVVGLFESTERSKVDENFGLMFDAIKVLRMKTFACPFTSRDEQLVEDCRHDQGSEKALLRHLSFHFFRTSLEVSSVPTVTTPSILAIAFSTLEQFTDWWV